MTPERRRSAAPPVVDRVDLAFDLCLFAGRFALRRTGLLQIGRTDAVDLDELFLRTQQNGHRPSFHPRVLVHRTDRLKLCDDLLEQLATDLLVQHLTASEEDSDLDLVAIFEEALRLTGLRVQIMVTDFRIDPHFLEDRALRFLARLSFLAALFIAEPPIIHEPADGRDGVGLNLDEIQALLARSLQGVPRLDNPKLRSVLINQTNLADTYTLVDSNWSSAYVIPPVERDRAGAESRTTPIFPTLGTG